MADFDDRQGEARAAFLRATGQEKAEAMQDQGREDKGQGDRQEEGRSAFQKSFAQGTGDDDKSEGRGDNSQQAGRGDGPGIEPGDELSATVGETAKEAAEERGQALHEEVVQQARNRRNDGPSL